MEMIRTKQSVLVVVLLFSWVASTLTLPSNVEEKKDVTVQDNRSNEGRFLEPNLFAVKRKNFTIGTGGVGTFFRAWRNCIDEGKSLATTDYEEEQTRLAALVAGHDTNYWIAATNLGETAAGPLTWITTDLRVLTAPISFSPVPNTCVSIDPTGAWHNNDCLDSTVVLPYLCEEYF